MAKLQPLGSRVLLKRISVQSKGGILIPDSAKEKPAEGIVVACAQGDEASKESDFTKLAEGSRVLFSSYSGMEVQFEGEEFVVVSLKDILGVLPS
ncbi:co-chaperone GroES [Candidatus Similichlamydia epinepheli]|uniref:co-chaperone GroES n=1 Tax=Candidatus Similichlamydia epinepheli TaxID=1903953 RepID=UPI000D3601B7|nr:co-chaperone GroES [Candidatus Similichlamydia epinepheli]